jgi:hypothetical protein
MPTSPNEPRPDHSPWILTGALLFAGMAYVTYVHPVLATPFGVGLAAVAVMVAVVRW